MFTTLVRHLSRTAAPLIACGLLSLGVGSAQANLVAQVPGGPFNALVFGDYRSTNADTWGGLIVGGRVELSQFGVNDRRASSFGLWAGQGGTIRNGSVTGHVTSNVQFAPDAGLNHGQRYDVGDTSRFTQMRQHYTSLSSTLAADASARTAYRDPWTGLVFNADAAATRHVFNVNAADLPNVRWLDIRNVDAEEELIINVIGSTAVFTNLDLSMSLGRYRTLLNYVDATLVHFSATAPWADILAPMAKIDGGNGHIQGTLVAAAFDSQLELHMGKTSFWFNPYSSGQGAAVPLPGTLPLTALALWAVVWVRRRPAAAAAPVVAAAAAA